MSGENQVLYPLYLLVAYSTDSDPKGPIQEELEEEEKHLRKNLQYIGSDEKNAKQMPDTMVRSKMAQISVKYKQKN